MVSGELIGLIAVGLYDFSRRSLNAETLSPPPYIQQTLSKHPEPHTPTYPKGPKDPIIGYFLG